MSEPLKNYEQASAWLGVPSRWLQARVQKGLVPHIRLGKHVRFTQAQLDQLVEESELPARNARPSSRPEAQTAEDMRPISRLRRPTSSGE